MIRTEIEKVYIVKKGGKELLVEIHRDPSGRLFVVPIYSRRHVYKTKSGEEKEWVYDTSRAEEVEYMSLPPDIRRALSKLQIF